MKTKIAILAAFAASAIACFSAIQSDNMGIYAGGRMRFSSPCRVVAARIDSTTGSGTYNLKVVTGAKTNILFGAISSVTSVTNLPSGKELYVAPGDYAFSDGVSATNGTANAIIFTER